MKKTLTKSLALLLAVLMLMTAMPMGVFAVNCTHENISKVNALGVSPEGHGYVACWECKDCGKYSLKAEPFTPLDAKEVQIHYFAPDSEYKDLFNETTDDHQVDKATCQHGDIYFKKCKFCDVYSTMDKYDAGNKADHDWSEEYSPEGADCTKAGFPVNHKCKVCGEVEKVRDVAKQNAHAIVNKPKENATCTAEGHESGVYCNNCLKYLTGGEVIAMIPHQIQVIEKGYAATCTKAGKTDFVGCKNCNTQDVPATVIPAINHVGGLIWVDKKVGTCEEDGYKMHARICKFCNTVFDPENTLPSAVVITATGHNPEIVEEQAATTSHKGCVKHYICKNKNSDGTECGQLFLQDKDENGHPAYDISTGKPVLRKATEAEVTIPIVEHTHKPYKDANLSKDKTCLEDGRLVMRCDTCQQIIQDDVLKATGHDWKWVESAAASCSENGSKYEKCSVCGATRGNPVPSEKKPHTWKLEKAADCTKGGKALYKCEVCGATEEREVTKQNSHTDADDNGVCDVCETKFCSCICHNQAWYGKILLFFVQVWWQFLGIRQTCACGKVHYVKAATQDVPSVT